MEVFNRNNSRNTGQLPILTSWMLISPQNSLTQNLSVQISEVPVGSEQPIHNHEPEQCYYIIKGNYKRWIQKAEIFNQYAHLRWQDIIEVSPEELAQYQEAWLIRADGDPRVYELNADGTKHWLNMTAEQFAITGHLWEMVYIVNSFERDSYLTGSDVLFKCDSCGMSY